MLVAEEDWAQGPGLVRGLPFGLSRDPWRRKGNDRNQKRFDAQSPAHTRASPAIYVAGGDCAGGSLTAWLRASGTWQGVLHMGRITGPSGK